MIFPLPPISFLEVFMLSDFLSFSLLALQKAVDIDVFLFIILPMLVMAIFAFIIRIIRRSF